MGVGQLQAIALGSNSVLFTFLPLEIWMPIATKESLLESTNLIRPALHLPPPLFFHADGSPNCHVQENYVSHAMSHLVSLYGRSSRNRLPQPPVFLSALSPAAYVASMIDCWMKLDMFRREGEGGEGVKKKDKHCGSCSACMPFARRGTCWDISSAAPLRQRAVQ